jgi:hypothetical protein
MPQPTAIALVNGRVFTADPARPNATALAIREGVVAYVGDDAQEARAAAGADAEVVDLAGRLATPGLIDAHCHPILYGEFLLGLDLTSERSTGAILELVRERAAQTPPGELVIGRGYYTGMIAEGRPPTRAELDRIAPNHVVALKHRSGHEMATNSLGLQRIGFTRDTPDPTGGYLGRDEHGEPDGLLVENAMLPLERVVLEAAPASYDEYLHAVTANFLSHGITSATEAVMPSAEVMRAYQRVLADPSRPRVRYNLMLDHWSMLEPVERLGITAGFGDDWLRLGQIKFFIDGTEGQRTAKLSEPFSDDPGNTGMWMFPPEEFRERVLRAHRAGWPCAVHAIGDAAIELTLDAYRDAQAEQLRPDIRHRVEHASLMRPDLIERFAREGVIPIPGARFASNDYPVLLPRFGPERLRWYQPWNSFFEYNIPVAISSDAPVQSPDPIKNLWAVITSRSEFDDNLIMQPEERLSLAEALIAYTRHGAYAAGQERRKGMLKPGMLGDVTVFRSDLFALEPDRLLDARVEMTVVGGEVAFRG